MAVVAQVADGERGVGQSDSVRWQQCIAPTNAPHDVNAASSVVRLREEVRFDGSCGHRNIGLIYIWEKVGRYSFQMTEFG